MLGFQFLICASKGPVNVVNQLYSIYNSPMKDSLSHHVHTHFAMITSNVMCDQISQI